MRRRAFLAALTTFFVSVRDIFSQPKLEKLHPLPPDKWVEPELSPTRDVVMRDAGHIIYPANPHYFRMGDICHCPETGENFMVLSVDAISLNVRRGLGCQAVLMSSGTAIWIVDNLDIQREALLRTGYQRSRRAAYITKVERR